MPADDVHRPVHLAHPAGAPIDHGEVLGPRAVAMVACGADQVQGRVNTQHDQADGDDYLKPTGNLHGHKMGGVASIGQSRRNKAKRGGHLWMPAPLTTAPKRVILQTTSGACGGSSVRGR